MALWLIFTIFAYFLLALGAIIDKVLLAGPMPNPKVYAFYVGLLGILVLALAPFGFEVPELTVIGMAFLSGGLWIFALFALYEALRRYEVSRVIPAIGGIMPVFTLVLSYFFAWQAGGTVENFNFLKIVSFVFLITGSVLITLEKKKKIAIKENIQLSALAAFLFSLSFVTAKLVYLQQPFVSGLIWIRISGFVVALFFLFFKEVRNELFQKRRMFQKKIKREHFLKQPQAKIAVLKWTKPKVIALFLFNQLMAAGAGVLQNLAVYLAPIFYLAFINALEGTRYVFLLALTIVISFKFPQVLSEKITRRILFQKTLAVFLIISGLLILAFS